MLEELFNKYGCDKSKKHLYHTVYEKEFDSVRNDEINILEIGVFKGDSIRAWLDFFPNATIYGSDTFQRIVPGDIDVLNHPRVKWLKADSTNIAIRDQIKKEWPRIRFDIIIDDGLHTPAANAKTLHNLYPLLKKDGKYYVEDVFPLDIMTMKEMDHWWVKKHSNVYNILEMNKFTKEIEDKDVKRFDLRPFTNEPDSYIIRVQ
jgi:ubiquinone/menaquinone biosynthesis C-methylase UbiE|tara:strand:- start:1444 stop:2055 length:612 start_codon:yes stop_codon:yes gene_type:complete